jgi:hypothetical protein
MYFFPLCSRFSTALAASQANMSAVMGQPIVALCFLARAMRMSLIVASFLAGTFFISSSTSIGAGMTMVPVPYRLLSFSVIFSTLRSPLLPYSFSTHDVIFFGINSPIVAL